MKSRDKGEKRMMIGVPHYSGDLDISEAGPIPESAGVIVKRRSTSSAKTRRIGSSAPTRKAKRRAS